MSKKQLNPINCASDNEMVQEGLRAQPLKKTERVPNTDSEKAMIRHMKALQKRGRLSSTTPMFLNKV